MKRPIFWLWLAIIVVTIAIIGAYFNSAKADSSKGKPLIFTWNNTGTVDSIRVQFCFPDSSNPYLQGLLTGGPKTWQYAHTAGLDSTGCHLVRVMSYRSGILSLYKFPWNNQGSAVEVAGADIAAEIVSQFEDKGYVGSGNGSEKDTIIVLNRADSTAVQGYEVTIRPHGGGLPSGAGGTDINGKFISGQNVGYVDIDFFKQGYNLADYNNYHVTKDTTLIFYALRISSVNMVTVLAALTDASGDTINPSYVEYRLVKKDTRDTTKYIACTKDDKITVGSGNAVTGLAIGTRRVTSVNSAFQFPLYPNSVLSKPNTYYEFTGIYKDRQSSEVSTIHVITQVPDTSQFNPFE